MSRTRARWARLAGAGAVVLVTGAIVAAHSPADDRHNVGRPSAATTVVTPSPRAAALTTGRTRPHRVFVVGDSLTVGTEPWLRSAFRRQGWSLAGVDARVGRPTAEGLRVLRARAARLPGTVLIALGTNDLGANARSVVGWLRTARAILGERRTIVWVDLCLADAANPALASFARINITLKKAAPRFGIHVADWCRYARRHGISPGPDGVHYGPAGYRRRAGFYAASLAATWPPRATTG